MIIHRSPSSIKRFLSLAVLLLSLFWTADSHAEECSFAIVIPSFNNEHWVKRNLDSVFSQSYHQFRVIYIDDGSSDGTADLVHEYIQKNALEQRITFIRNEKHEGSLACLYRAVQNCSPDEIVIQLDGCDWLAHHQVLEQLGNLYADSDVWLTYGQFCSYPSYAYGNTVQIPQIAIDNNDLRAHVQASPFKTFYAGLFKHIKKEDLLKNGVFYPAHLDLALSLPLLELAGSHSRYIPEVQYIHNAYRSESAEIGFSQKEQIIRSKEKYPPLTHYKQQIPLKKIYITPGLWGELFSISNPIFNRDNCLDVMYRLRNTAREAGYELLQAHDLESLQDFEYLIVFDIFSDQLEALSRYPKEKKILFLWEPPSVLPENYNVENHSSFSKVYTWNDRLVDNQKYFKFFYPVIQPMIPDTVDYHSKQLCTLIACNKASDYPGELYSERLKLIHFFEYGPYDGFILYGKWWPGSYSTYAGPIDKKVDTLKFFRFCYAYENIENIPGYITEKIFDCFHAGTVPIYWGAPNIRDYIPKGCFIAREDFSDNEELYSYIRNMDEEHYQQYLENIRTFLGSPEAQLYSKEHFISLFMKLINQP